MNTLRLANSIMLLAFALFLLLFGFLMITQAEAQTWNIDYAGDNSPTFAWTPDCDAPAQISSGFGYPFSFVLNGDMYVGTQNNGTMYRYNRDLQSWTTISLTGTEKFTDCDILSNWSTTSAICAGWDSGDGTYIIWDYDGTNMTERISGNIDGMPPSEILPFVLTCAATEYDGILPWPNNVTSNNMRAYKVSTNALYEIASTNSGTWSISSVIDSTAIIAKAGGSVFKILSDCTVSSAAYAAGDLKQPAAASLLAGNDYLIIPSRVTATPHAMVCYAPPTCTDFVDTENVTECNTSGGAQSDTIGQKSFYVRAEKEDGTTIAKVQSMTYVADWTFTSEKDLGADYSETGRPLGIFLGANDDLYVVMQNPSVNSVYCYGTCTPVESDTQQGNIDSGDFMF